MNNFDRARAAVAVTRAYMNSNADELNALIADQPANDTILDLLGYTETLVKICSAFTGATPAQVLDISTKHLLDLERQS